MFAYARLDAIFQALRGGACVPAQALAQRLGVTERTVRSDIAKLNEALAAHGARIESKRGAGYRLVVKDKAALDALAQGPATAEGITEGPAAVAPDRTLESAQGRQRLMLYTLLQAPGPVGADELAATLYVGGTTLRDYTRRIRELLATYGLGLVGDPQHGLCVTGREVDRRRCFTHCVLERNMGSYLAGITPDEECWFEGVDLPLLRRTLRAHLDHFELAPDDFAEKNALMHLALSVLRVRGGRVVEPPDGPVEMPLSAEFFMAETCDDVERLFAVELPAPERQQLYRHFVSNGILQPEPTGDEALRHGIEALLADIHESYGFDLRADESLKASLLDHLRYAFRSRELGVSKKNPLVNTIRTSYPLAFEIALMCAGRAFHDPAQHLSEDEVGYIALHVGAAIERSAPQAGRLPRAVLVCGAGRSMAAMLEGRLQTLFGDRLEIARTIGIGEFSQDPAAACAGAQLVVTTQDLGAYPLPAVHVDYGLGAHDTEAIARLLNGLGQAGAPPLGEFFSAACFMRAEGTASKEALLEQMAAQLVAAGIAGPDFLGAVLERERMAATDISPAFAIPHALSASVERSRVGVALLEQPMRWNEQAPRVQIVFLLAFRPGDKLDFERLFDLMLEIARSDRLQRRILAAQSYGEFLAALRVAD